MFARLRIITMPSVRSLTSIVKGVAPKSPSIISTTFRVSQVPQLSLVRTLATARRVVRRPRVAVEEATETRAGSVPATSSNSMLVNLFGRKPDKDDEVYGNQESYVTADVSGYLAQVYSTLGMTTLTATVGAMGFMYTPLSGTVSPMVLGLVSFAPLLGLMFTQGTTPLRYGLLHSFAFLSGAAMAPMLSHFLHVSPGVVGGALAGTTAIFGGFTLMALRSKRKSMLTMGGPLTGGLFALLALQLGNAFLPLSPATHAALTNVYLYGGLGIFSLFISFDTQRMIENAREGIKDPISDALNMFLNLRNIFQFLMIILGRNND